MTQRPRLQWYRWEGVYSADFTLEGVRRRGRRLGEVLLEQQWSCLIAHDTRFMAAQFARYTFRLIEQSGARVSFCPTPASLPMVELAIERRRFESALLIGAGNRPHWYLGMQVLVPSSTNPFEYGAGPLSEPPAPFFPPEPFAASEQTQIDLRTPYLQVLREAVDLDLIRRSTLTFFVDPMNGTTSGLLPSILGEGAQTRAVEINREADPLFARQTPQPTEATLTRLRKLVKESDSHLGVAISADGRALGVADNAGDLITPHELALLLAQHLGLRRRLRGVVVVPQTANPPGVAAWEAATGLRVEVVADPAARIAEIVAQDRHALLIGTTAAGEITLGRYGATPDGALAALLLLEMVAQSGSKLRPQVDQLRTRLKA